MTRTIWNAEHGWHETDDTYQLVLLDNGRIHWVNTTQEETDEDE
jgi:hypothetical protein